MHISKTIFTYDEAAMLDMKKLSRRDMRILELKNKAEIMKMVYEIKFADNPKLAQRLKDRVNSDLLKQVIR